MSQVPTTISIDGTEYVRANSVKDPVPSAWRIVVGQNGHVFVGRYCVAPAKNTPPFSVSGTFDEVVLYDAKVIRFWGTTAGLGELALNGPTPKTVLDKCGVVRLHPLSVVATLDTYCWEK